MFGFSHESRVVGIKIRMHLGTDITSKLFIEAAKS